MKNINDYFNKHILRIQKLNYKCKLKKIKLLIKNWYIIKLMIAKLEKKLEKIIYQRVKLVIFLLNNLYYL